MAKKNTTTRSTSAQHATTHNLDIITTSEAPDSQLPPQLAAIYELLKAPPEELPFSSQAIDEIVEGRNLRDHLGTIDEGRYLDNFLPLVGWWVKVAHPLFEMGVPAPTKSAVECEENVLESKLEGLFLLYRIAFIGRYNVDCIGSDPTGLELVKRLREFRRYVCTLAQRDFPDADLSGLLKLA